MMFMKNYRDLPIRQLHIMELPYMTCVLGHKRHIVLMQDSFVIAI